MGQISTTRRIPLNRHGKKAVLLYFDGHAGGKNAIEIVPDDFRARWR
jgi:prepilin-type processing-associated H-X9-DG protein